MILVIDCGSTKVPFICEMIDEYMDVKSIKLEDFNIEMKENVSGIIISGASILLSEVDYHPYLEKFEWIKTYEQPILGICFGHQIIGLLNGASIHRQKEDRSWNEIELTEEEDLLFDKLPTVFEMMEDHCEAISIPAHFKHLAVSDSCINEAMKHESKPIYGVQFHPEVSGNLGSLLFDNFVKICNRQSANS